MEINSEIDFKKYVITVSPTPLSQVLLGNLIFYYCLKKYADLCNMKTHYSLMWGPWFYIHFCVCKNLPLDYTEPDASRSDLHIRCFVAMSQVSRNSYIIYIYIYIYIYKGDIYSHAVVFLSLLLTWCKDDMRWGLMNTSSVSKSKVMYLTSYYFMLFYINVLNSNICDIGMFSYNFWWLHWRSP